MHEMSLMESVLEITCDTALREGAQRVTRIRLDIGMLSHVEPEALIFCYDAIRQGTMAADASLEIERSPGKGWCADCGQTMSIEARYDPCPSCGRFDVRVTSGDEMKIKQLEVI